MSKRLFFLLILTSIFGLQNLSAQADDPVLFSVEGNPVNLSEFEYIYKKTNGDRADFSKKTLEEYLDLYVKFKLKVHKAKEMKLDTILQLQQELDGYRQQLANSYLVDKEVTERLVREAYERAQRDIDISHIMVTVPPTASPKDTLLAFEKVNNLLLAIQDGADFAAVAASKSDDNSAKANGGNIGYLTALLPNGFYDFETAAYTLKEGEMKVVKSAAGYHILKVNGSRPARGEVEAAHILIRKDKEDNGAKAKARIDSIYQVLQSGKKDFETLARTLSQDNLSAGKGGNIGFFGINRYEKSFENTAFELEDGKYSTPIETAVGWHIIKKIRKKPHESYDIAKRKLQPKIQKDGRYEAAKTAMLERIKRDGNFKEASANFEKFMKNLSEDYKTHRWKPNPEKPSDVLFSMDGGVKFTVADFEAFSQKNSRDRLREGRNKNLAETVNFVYNKFISESLLKYEERQLEKKYPEFKALMREYEEGILLFEATKILVWDKASQDSVGLQKYFEANRGKRKYMWNERAEVSFYTLKKEGTNLLKKVRKKAKRKSPEKMLAKFNKKQKVLSHRTEIIEKGKNKVVDSLPWKKKAISATEVNKRDSSSNFLKIEKILPKSEKSLKEARGYVVADYQDHLEREWVKELKKNYEIKINEAVFETMIKE